MAQINSNTASKSLNSGPIILSFFIVFQIRNQFSQTFHPPCSMVTVHSNLNFSRFQVLLTRCKSSLTVWREATIIGLSSESEESCYVDKKTSETIRQKKSLKQTTYQKMVSVCFLIAFLTTSFASSTFIFRQFRPATANNFCSDTF